LRIYKTEAAARRKAAEIKRKGYGVKVSQSMGDWELWVSPRYFKDHPRVRGVFG
jgi:hypothetical protein